jgi:glycosyltransferase involved in cell wall biosynthesis
MPEVVGDGAAVFFDPDDRNLIAEALVTLLDDDVLRERSSARAYERAAAFSWTACTRATFAFLREIAEQAKEQGGR